MTAVDFESDLQKAIEFHKNGNLVEAKSRYQAIINSGANNPHAYHNLSLIIMLPISTKINGLTAVF